MYHVPILCKFGGFLELGVPVLGGSIIRIIVLWGLFWFLIQGNYHIVQIQPRSNSSKLPAANQRRWPGLGLGLGFRV